MDIDEIKPDKVNDEPIKKVVESNSTGILLQQSNALSSLAQYTDSDDSGAEAEYTDSDVDENQAEKQYRDAKSSSSSSSSSESSDEEITIPKIKEILDKPASDHDSDSDGDEAGDSQRKRKKKEPLKVKGEFLLDDLPPIEELQIQVDEKECLELGTITSIVDQLVLVEAYPHSAPLDIDSILFVERGKKALGQIFDVIGPVSMPIYCIRFNSNDDIKTKGIAVGDKVFCAPRTEYTSYVVLTSIMGKGSDASWKNDVEPPESLLEYSDDEQERRSKKLQKKHTNRDDNSQQQPGQQNFNRGMRRPRFPHQNNNFAPQQQPYNNNNFNNYQQPQQYQQYPMSWHQQYQQQPPQQNLYNSFGRYDKFFQQQ